MRTRVLPALLAALCVAGCVPRNRINTDCRWMGEARSHLEITRAADVRHLMSDAMIAEDLAIRYADVTRGRRSGHFAGWDEYESAREQCMTTLFAAAADTHGVDAQQVRALVERRPLAVDVAVFLAFGVLYVAVSFAATGAILNRFSLDAPAAAIVASLAVAPVLSVSGVLVLGIWAGLIDTLRFGNMHMSYRVDRLPWGHHPLALFAAGIVVFLATAAWRGASLERPPPGGLHSQFPRARP